VSTVGVNLAGYLDATLGVGEAARQVRGALQAAGVPVASLPVSSRGAPASPGPHPAPHPVTLVCANPDGLQGVRDELGDAPFAGRHVVGLWWWEVASFPSAWARGFDGVDEVWAGSRFVADAIAAVSPVPVVHLPTPVAAPVVAPVGRRELGLPADAWLAGLAYDYGSVAARKNPLGAIAAFTRAFGHADGAALVVKTLRSELDPAAHAEVLAAAREHPHVHVIDRDLPAAEKNALIGHLDCLLSVHRSEGFGLALAEAALLGVPVVATDYGGTRDFLTPFNAWLVDHRPARIGRGNEPYPADGEWAEPDLDHAASLLRAVRDAPGEASRRAQRAREDVARAHDPLAAGGAMAARLARIVRSPVAAASGPVDGLSLETARARVRGGPGPGSASGVRDAVRTAVLRAMAPFAVHQRLVDEEMLRALQTLDERVRGLAAAQSSLAAELARLRREAEEHRRAGA
jgi:glycosyltransferase involved in cell wall biosynthesis